MVGSGETSSPVAECASAAGAGETNSPACRYAEWLQRIGSGDPQAETALVLFFAPGVRAIVGNLGVPPGNVADVVQDALLDVLLAARKGRIAQPATLRSFVARTARNAAIDHLRSGRSRQTVHGHDLEQLVDESSSPLERLDLAQAHRVVLEVIGGLSERDATLLKSYYLDDEERVALSTRLEMSPSQFDRTLWRIKQKVRIALKKLGLE